MFPVATNFLKSENLCLFSKQAFLIYVQTYFSDSIEIVEHVRQLLDGELKDAIYAEYQAKLDELKLRFLQQIDVLDQSWQKYFCWTTPDQTCGELAPIATREMFDYELLAFIFTNPNVAAYLHHQNIKRYLKYHNRLLESYQELRTKIIDDYQMAFIKLTSSFQLLLEKYHALQERLRADFMSSLVGAAISPQQAAIITAQFAERKKQITTKSARQIALLNYNYHQLLQTHVEQELRTSEIIPLNYGNGLQFRAVDELIHAFYLESINHPFYFNLGLLKILEEEAGPLLPIVSRIDWKTEGRYLKYELLWGDHEDFAPYQIQIKPRGRGIQCSFYQFADDDIFEIYIEEPALTAMGIINANHESIEPHLGQLIDYCVKKHPNTVIHAVYHLLAEDVNFEDLMVRVLARVNPVLVENKHLSFNAMPLFSYRVFHKILSDESRGQFVHPLVSLQELLLEPSLMVDGVDARRVNKYVSMLKDSDCRYFNYKISFAKPTQVETNHIYLWINKGEISFLLRGHIWVKKLNQYLPTDFTGKITPRKLCDLIGQQVEFAEMNTALFTAHANSIAKSIYQYYQQRFDYALDFCRRSISGFDIYMQELAKRYHHDLVTRLPGVNFSLKTYAIAVHPDDIFLTNKPLITTLAQKHLQTLAKMDASHQDEIDKVEQIQALGDELGIDLSQQFFANATHYLYKKELMKSHVDSLMQRIAERLNLPHLRELTPLNGSFSGVDYSQECYHDLRPGLGLA